MPQRDRKRFRRGRSALGWVGLPIFAFTVWLSASGQVWAEELLKSPSAFDNFGKFDESKVEKWKELESPLPAYPDDVDLIRVRLPVTYTIRVYVDKKSVSLLKDGIARFTYIVESPSGARNVFFEGYNCDTREYKLYATGMPDRTFEAVKKPVWQRVEYYEVNAFRFQLLRHNVCDPDALSIALTPRNFVRRLIDSAVP